MVESLNLMTRISQWLLRISSGKVALISLVIFLVFTALVLPDQASRADEVSAEAGTPDLSFFYTPDDLYRMAEAYGGEGRVEYIRARFTFDLAWPVVYTLFLVTALSWILQRAVSPGSRVGRLNLVPLFGAVFDYLENISTSLVMWRYPQETAVVDWLASLFTPAKWILISVAFVVLLAGIVQVMRRGIVSKRAKPKRRQG
jgi:hypothetical protein